MKLRFGLQARFLAAITLMLGVVVLVLVLVMQRQHQIRAETEALSSQAVHRLVDTYLRDQAAALDTAQAWSRLAVDADRTETHPPDAVVPNPRPRTSPSPATQESDR